jgi:hypothetical protein
VELQYVELVEELEQDVAQEQAQVLGGVQEQVQVRDAVQVLALAVVLAVAQIFLP